MFDALLITNGTILTMDPAQPEVEAVGVIGETIVAAGTRQAVEQMLPANYQSIDLGGQTMLPGFNEAHNHMIGYGTALGQIDTGFPAVKSIADIVSAVKRASIDHPSRPVDHRARLRRQQARRATPPESLGS